VERSSTFLGLFKTFGNIVAEGSESDLPALSSQLLSRIAHASAGGFGLVDTERERVGSNSLPGPSRCNRGFPHALWRGANLTQVNVISANLQYR
jgi:hypothetical protein